MEKEKRTLDLAQSFMKSPLSLVTNSNTPGRIQSVEEIEAKLRTQKLSDSGHVPGLCNTEDSVNVRKISEETLAEPFGTQGGNTKRKNRRRTKKEGQKNDAFNLSESDNHLLLTDALKNILVLDSANHSTNGTATIAADTRYSKGTSEKSLKSRRSNRETNNCEPTSSKASAEMKEPPIKKKSKRSKKKAKDSSGEIEHNDSRTSENSREIRESINDKAIRRKTIKGAAKAPGGQSVVLEIQEAVNHTPAIFFRRRDSSHQHINLSYADHPFYFATKIPLSINIPDVTSSTAFRRRIPPSDHGTMKNDQSDSIAPPQLQTSSSQSKKAKRSKSKASDAKPSKFKPYLPYSRIQQGLESGEMVKGVVRINPKNYREAYVSNENRRVQDFLITSVKDRNRALDGDEVILKCKPKVEWRDGQKTAEVVFIEKQVHPRTAVGILSLLPNRSNRMAQLNPRDKRIPPIRIPASDWPKNFHAEPKKFSDTLFLAKLTDWVDPRHANGTLCEAVGKISDLEVETKALLLENGLDIKPFPPEVYQFLPKSKDIPSEEIRKREDLRKICVFTIDPPTAKDLDDAVSVQEFPNGKYEIGVHIADVSFYLEEATPLDILVSQKATTVYLVKECYHMLPPELCFHCSLLPGKDALAFSVFWMINKEGTISSTRFERTIINSCCQLSYDHAQEMISSSPEEFSADRLPEIKNGFQAKDLCKTVNILHGIANKLRDKRFRNGALRIDQPKINFTLDYESGEPIDWNVYENTAAHRLIEEFMLLANITVAERILQDSPEIALLRCHEEPNMRLLEETKEMLTRVGVHLDINSSGELQGSIRRYDRESTILGMSRLQVLNHLVAKPMTRATYFCAGLSDYYHHYALSVPVYTHFTSPIRRYADVMVHRLLAASLGYAEPLNWSPEFVAYVAGNCNVQKLNAKRAGEASSDLYFAHYVEKHQPYIEHAVVVDVKDRSCDVILLKTGHVLRVYYNTFEEGATYVVDTLAETPRKLYRTTVTFPPKALRDLLNIVLEIFQIVVVGITRKKKSNKLQAKLLPDKPVLNCKI